MEKKTNGEKTKGRGLSNASATQRPCKEHSFLTDVADVRVMEQGLLQLLEDFHSGKLQAFGGTDMYDKMNEIRSKQEQLAQLHFDLDLQQDMRRMASEEARTRNYEQINKMIGKLQGLSTSIQQLPSK
ncbi:coiled-coil domain-containing protein 28A-like [Ruditapes philippinarum]|uniref:coiled-coil domain-containing protein 28A-like n=1 Tax=Ruditapes philippinarum TaxID=129788 RepID=UPI00295A9CAB|nr:coiled-coil domain-containing protein 28A-like [Ruditapes philippinarum]